MFIKVLAAALVVAAAFLVGECRPSEAARGATGAPPAVADSYQGVPARPEPPEMSPAAAERPQSAWPDTLIGQFMGSLSLSTIPVEAHGRYIKRVECESGFDPSEVGDNGLAWGLTQIRVDVRPDLAAKYDLFDPVQNLNAAYEHEADAARMGLPTPWVRCDA